MKSKKKKQVGISSGAIGLGVLAAAAAGAYFLERLNTARNRKRLRGWMMKMKGEVMEKVESMKDVNELAYHKAVDAAVKRYRALKNIDGDELEETIRQLKGAWRQVEKQVNRYKKEMEKSLGKGGKKKK